MAISTSNRKQYVFRGSSDYISDSWELIYLKNIYKVFVRDDCDHTLHEPLSMVVEKFYIDTFLIDVKLSIAPNVRLIIESPSNVIVSLFVYSS